MNILLLAATPREIEPTLILLRERAERQEMNRLIFPRCTVTVAFSGLGSMHTAFLFAQYAAADPPPNLAIQAGIAGAVDAVLQLGEVVNVHSECLVDLGAEDSTGAYLNPADLGFPPAYPYDARGVLHPPALPAILPFRNVAGGTVNRTTGTTHSLLRLREKFPDVQVETMEGAGFFYAGMMTGVEVLQLRAISNYVGARNRESWDIPLAVHELNAALWRVLEPFLQRADREH